MNAGEKELLHRHLNGDLDAAEQAAFFARLEASPELRRELASLALDEALISELVLEKRTAVRPKRRAWLPAAAVAAVMLIGLTLLLSLGKVRDASLRVASFKGSAVLLRDGRQEALYPGQDLRFGDRIATSGGSALLERKGLRLELGSNSVFELQKLKGTEWLVVEKGIVLARVSSDREQQLALPSGTLGTKAATIRIDAGPRRTRIEVEEGSVDLSSHPANPIVAGQYISITGAAHEAEIGRVVGRVPVENAIRKACAFLESRRSDLVLPIISEKRNAPPPRRTYAEIALLALHRAGYADSHPLKAELLGQVRGRPVESTYVAALQAMTLAEIDPAAHQDRIRLCAQLLCDSQCTNGQWDYAVKLALPDVPATGRIRRRKEGPPGGDNSVTSYAVLGLLAAHEAGVDIDPEVLDRARGWWLRCQNRDGGWGYNDINDPSPGEAGKDAATSNTSYGSMTAAALAALAALKEIHGDHGKPDAAMKNGVAWLGANFAADRTPRKAPGFLPLHWLSMAGHAGQLLATEHFGAHDWYAEGAEFLLRTQHPTGEWTAEQGEFMRTEKMDVLDTCLAILFLRRDPR
jgi:ferric-dicitrate binding protein FerR (iron transport regulator)